MNSPMLCIMVLTLASLMHGLSCAPQGQVEELDEMGTVDMTIAGQVFRLWIADELAEQLNGLMRVTAERMTSLPDGTERGMIFVFDHEDYHSFWMKNVIIPLDIAYIDSDGTIVSTYTMAPLDDRQGRYPSGQPVRYAIEVNANVWARLGVNPGVRLDIPSSLLKRSP